MYSQPTTCVMLLAFHLYFMSLQFHVESLMAPFRTCLSVVILLMYPMVCQGNGNQVCRQIKHACGDDGPVAGSTCLQGSRGKVGEKGSKGEPGHDGLPGPPRAPARGGFARAISELEAKFTKEISKLKRSLEKLNSNSDYRATEEFCKVYYGGKCFWYVHESCTYSEAEAICARVHGGRPAVLYSAIHYKQSMTYIRSVIDMSVTIFWLGIKINPSTKEVTIIPDGTPAPFVKWVRGYPNFEPGLTRAMVELNKDPSKGPSGMFNSTGPKRSIFGVLCEA